MAWYKKFLPVSLDTFHQVMEAIVGSDPMRGMDPTYLRTYVTVDECESPDCQEVD